PAVYWHWARAAIEAGDFNLAGKLLAAVNQCDASDPRVRALTARWYSIQGDPAAARQALSPGPDGEPADASVWCKVIESLIEMREIGLAREAGQEAMRVVVPLDPQLLWLQARLEAKVNPGRALGLLYRLKRIRPGK